MVTISWFGPNTENKFESQSKNIQIRYDWTMKQVATEIGKKSYGEKIIDAFTVKYYMAKDGQYYDFEKSSEKTILQHAGEKEMQVWGMKFEVTRICQIRFTASCSIKGKKPGNQGIVANEVVFPDIEEKSLIMDLKKRLANTVELPIDQISLWSKTGPIGHNNGARFVDQ
jgi:hypothetical protein